MERKRMRREAEENGALNLATEMDSEFSRSSEMEADRKRGAGSHSSHKDVHESIASCSHSPSANNRMQKSPLLTKEKSKEMDHWKVSRRAQIKLGHSFQIAVVSRCWELAEAMISSADLPCLNDALCVTLDSVWFLTTSEDLQGISSLLKKIVATGANDFTRAVLRTSFLASCVAACHGTMSHKNSCESILLERLHEHLRECHARDVLMAEAGAKVQRFMIWALKCISFHCRSQDNKLKHKRCTMFGVQLQLSAFKTFLGLASNSLTGREFTEAFDAACFPLTLFSGFFDHGWSYGTSSTAIQGLLEMLIESGAFNVNQCFLEACRFGSTELVRILLQISRRNVIDLDLDLALAFASHYCKIRTMECLVDEGNAIAFLGPLMRAAERGYMEVVQWFVSRGCRDMELCLALTAAVSNSQVGIAEYLLPRIAQHILNSIGTEILKTAGENNMSRDGITFLLRSNFLGNMAATYSVANNIATSSDESLAPELKAYLAEHWSDASFVEGQLAGKDHFVNIMRILHRGRSPISLGRIPQPLLLTISYMPLYRECLAAGGLLLPQSLRGQLVDAVSRLCSGDVSMDSHAGDLLSVLRQHLPNFLLA